MIMNHLNLTQEKGGEMAQKPGIISNVYKLMIYKFYRKQRMLTDNKQKFHHNYFQQILTIRNKICIFAVKVIFLSY